MTKCQICCAAFWILNGGAVLSGIMFAAEAPLTIALLIVGGFNIGCKLLCNKKKPCATSGCPKESVATVTKNTGEKASTSK